MQFSVTLNFPRRLFDEYPECVFPALLYRVIEAAEHFVMLARIIVNDNAVDGGL